MIEFGYAVACGDRHPPIDFSPQLSHTSRKVFQFARPPVHFPKSAAVATRKFAWGWVGFEIRSAAEQYRRHAMLPTRGRCPHALRPLLSCCGIWPSNAASTRTSSPASVGRRDRPVDPGLLSAGVPGALSAIIVEQPFAIGACGAK